MKISKNKLSGIVTCTVKKIKPEIHGLVPINQELVFKYQVISTKREVFMGWFMNTIYWY